MPHTGYDGLLLKEVLHHVEDRAAVITGLARHMSLLSSFDDAQIEAGVTEIRRAHPDEQITFTDTFAFVLGTVADGGRRRD